MEKKSSLDFVAILSNIFWNYCNSIILSDMNAEIFFVISD